MMFDEAKTTEQHEVAVRRMEEALRQLQEDIVQYVRLYVDAIEYTPAMALTYLQNCVQQRTTQICTVKRQKHC